MKLFRGYKQLPRWPIPKIKQELAELEAECRAIPGTIIDAIKTMGRARFIRLTELRVICSPQFFTDQPEVAREFAGEKGFLITLEVPDDVAQKHYRGEQVMRRGGVVRYVSNYVFKGEEILHQNTLNPSSVEFIQLEREHPAKESDPPPDYLSGGPERMM